VPILQSGGASLGVGLRAFARLALCLLLLRFAMLRAALYRRVNRALETLPAIGPQLGRLVSRLRRLCHRGRYIMPGPLRPSRPYKFRHSVSPEQLEAIGMIAVEGSELESALEWGIWGLSGMTVQTGQLFTTRQAFEMKVKTFIRVTQKVIRDPDMRKRAANLAGRLRDSSGRRNDIIHAIWPDDEAETALTPKLGDKGAKLDAIQTDPGSLRQIAADLRGDFLDLMHFLSDTEMDSPRSESDDSAKG
jgi:hypothetical protein